MADAVAVRRCACGAELPPAFLACPRCHRLVYAEELAGWAAQAEAAEREGRTDEALELWRRALDHLPEGTRQREQLVRRVEALTAAGGGKAKSKGGKTGIAVGVGATLAMVLSKGKLLALGFTKLGTLVSMFAAMGLYATLWGWKFAAGFLLSIYIHEIGHVAALRRLGIAASAPMFIPGLGAFVRMRQYPASPREDAQVGLAGPIWGLGAALACLGLAWAFESEFFRALTRAGAFINLFNLIPLSSLDGGRGFRALTRNQRWVAVAVLAGAFFVSGEGLLLVLAAAAVFRAFQKDAPTKPGNEALVTYAVLVISLSMLATIEVATAR